ncbi:hypothetical protein GCM10010994_57390 [Chelatococcus reniformis]|uniref:Lipoprotein n=1 Tax=Chelatococcus reniformis TaxID=1494448 RepID=A0A916UXU9_9HYPH|nr:hypothetical protein GCM10010994_57390 [Chelatococcus reniformis]
MHKPFVLGALLLSLAACQSPQDSMVDAQMTCSASGLRPGTRAYERCESVNYQQNRQKSDQTANAVAVGAAAGVVGGALLGAATAPRPYYYRCRGWGCW